MLPLPPIPGVALRPIAPEDRDFLFSVYAATREEELALTDWDEEKKREFLTQQFEAQHAYYQANYQGADFLVVLRDGEPAGRLYLHPREDEIRLVDIALLPAHRGAGLGTAILHALLAYAGREGKPLRIHVERFNPALRLYQRLGFREVADKGVYLLLERAPEPPASE